MKQSSTKMKYIVTSIQYNARVNKGLLENMLNFAKEHGVDKIYAFLQRGRFVEEMTIDPLIDEHNIQLIDKLKLNNSLMIHDTKVLPQQINPFTGLNQKLSRDYSYILPSPKIRYQSLANTSKYPRALMSTGALTHGNYKDHTAHGRKALEQHQYGFVYVEIQDGKIFHAHQIESSKQGDFHYMREKYHSGKVLTESPEALVLGDWHTGDTCTKVRKKTIAMLHELKPKRVVFHDLFNGHSINHHERGHLLSELKSRKEKRHSLEDELRMVLKEVQFFAQRFPDIEFLVAESNHDLFLERYIQEKRFMEDTENFLLICQMIPELLLNKKAILEVALSNVGKLPINFHFLKEDQSYRVRGVALDYHGHRGVNGSRGTSASFDRHNLKMITGHEHSPKLFSNGMVVGTSTKLKLGYTKGAGSWLNAHGILYANGKYGLITII